MEESVKSVREHGAPLCFNNELPINAFMDGWLDYDCC